MGGVAAEHIVQRVRDADEEKRFWKFVSAIVYRLFRPLEFSMYGDNDKFASSSAELRLIKWAHGFKPHKMLEKGFVLWQENIA